MPLRSERKWKRYIKRTADLAPQVYVDRQVAKIERTLSDKVKERELRRLEESVRIEGKTGRERAKVIAKIIANTVIKETGLTKTLTKPQLKKLKELTVELAMAGYDREQMPKQTGENYYRTQTGRIMPDILEIVGAKKIQKFIDTYAEYGLLAGQVRLKTGPARE